MARNTRQYSSMILTYTDLLDSKVTATSGYIMRTGIYTFRAREPDQFTGRMS